MTSRRKWQSTVLRFSAQGIPGICFLIAWQFLGTRPSVGFFFSTPLAVAKTLVALTVSGELGINTAITAGEALAGFLLGNIVGSALGLGLWYSEVGALIARPYLTILGAIPVFALAPMTILWFGIGIGAKVALSFLGTVLVASAQAHRAVSLTDPLLIRRFRVFGASRRMIFWHLLLPSAALWIVGSLRLTIGTALLGAFVGEFIASDRGLGHLILRASGVYDTATVVAGVVAMAALAMALDAVVNIIELRVRRGRGSTLTSTNESR